MFNFGALARARAGMLKGAAEGEQERYEREQQAAALRRAEEAQAFQRWATERQMARMAAQDAYGRQRDAMGDQRTRERDQLDAIQSGGEAAPEMVGSQLLAGLNAMRGGGGNTAFRMPAPRTTPFRQTVAGVDVAAEDMGGPTYGTAGGRTFRFDRQRGANVKAREAATDAALDVAADERRQRGILAAIGARQGGGAGGGVAGDPTADPRGEMALRKEFNAEMTRHTQIAPAFAKIKESAQLGTGQGDMGIIYGFMRMQDPGSTVREGEYATAQNSAGVPDQVRQLYNKALSGEKLAPEVRQRFVQAAERLVQTERAQARQAITRYAGLAVRYGMPANAVVYDPYDEVMGPYQTGGGGYSADNPFAGGRR